MKSLETGWVGHWGPLPLWWRLWEWIPPAICNGRRDLNTKSIITVRTSYWSRCCYAVQDSAVCLITSCCLSFSYFYFLGYWFQNAYSLRKGQDASNFYVNSRLCFYMCYLLWGISNTSFSLPLKWSAGGSSICGNELKHWNHLFLCDQCV